MAALFNDYAIFDECGATRRAARSNGPRGLSTAAAAPCVGPRFAIIVSRRKVVRTVGRLAIRLGMLCIQ